MCKIAVRLAINCNALYSQLFKKTWHNYTAHAVYRIKCHFKMRITNSRHIHGFKRKHRIYMLLGKISFFYMAKLFNRGEIEILFFRQCQYLLPLNCC